MTINQMNAAELPTKNESPPPEDCGDPAPNQRIGENALPPRSPVPTSADVVIIGAGIAGTSVAYQLSKTARRRKIVLLEQGEIAGGSTRYSAACFRKQFTRVFNVQVNQISEKHYRGDIARLLGYDPLKQVGYLFLKRTLEQFKAAKKQAADQAGWGVQVEALCRERIKESFPFVNTKNVVGAIFGAHDGFIKSPETIAACLAEAFEENGGQVFQRVGVLKIETRDNEIRRVHTTRGTIETKTVINCAGAWSAKIAETAGAIVQVEPVPRQLTLLEQHPSLPLDRMPMTITPDGCYIRPEGQVLMAGFAPHDTAPSFNAQYNPELGLYTIGKLAEYIPVLNEVGIRPQGIAGLYEITPDHNALVGYDYRVKGLLHCCGFSGHGVMQAPGAAQLIVELLEYGRVESLHPLIYAPLRADRFENPCGVSFKEDNVI